MSPVSLHDDAGRLIGSYSPAADANAPRETPPPMIAEQRAELQRRIDDRENSLTLDELLNSMNLEDPSPNSKS
jgi:hypothetical protein